MNVGSGGLLLVGCGKMGGALLRGWLEAGLAPADVSVFDPYPADWLSDLVHKGLTLNQAPTEAPSVVVVATKPQIMADALPELKNFGAGSTLFISVAAGTEIATFETMLGAGTPVVRTMPNTPAAIGAGITALVASPAVSQDQLDLAEQLMQAVGETVVLDTEEKMHAVTALSGSGPAYVFAFAEALTKAGTALDLPEELAQKLAIATIAGAGRLMAETGEQPSDLRVQVTSPAGTTAAGLEALQAAEGLDPLVQKTLDAASARSRELAKLG